MHNFNTMLKDAYTHMLRSRLLDRKMHTMQRNGEIGTYAGSAGCEAMYVGIALAMANKHTLVPYYREQPALLMRGYTPIDFMRYWGGDERGNTVGDDFPICVPIATQCLHGVGAAYANQLLNKKEVIVISLGDGATSKGDFYESLNFAALNRLKVIFTINNNGWAISVPLKKQSPTSDLASRGKSFGIKVNCVDGLDVEAVYNAMCQSIESVTLEGGPRLIDFKTTRLCDHTTADDAKRYKSAELIAKENKMDPLLNIEEKLQKQYGKTIIHDIHETIHKEIQTNYQKYLEDSITLHH